MVIFSSMMTQGSTQSVFASTKADKEFLRITCFFDSHENLTLRIEKFLEIIENTGFDLIGGGVGEGFQVGTSLSFFNNWLNYGKYKVTKGVHGDCVSREFGLHGQGFQSYAL